MTELQQARADYIAALEREQKLMKEVANLQRHNFELQSSLIGAITRASVAEAMSSGLLRSMFTL